MSLRISSLLAALAVLAACSETTLEQVAGEDAERIACAVGPGAELGEDCLLERTGEGDAQVLVVWHPGGGFRRFEQLPDGEGLAALDGADEVSQSLDGDMLEVEVAGDRYRFPARVSDGDAGS